MYNTATPPYKEAYNRKMWRPYFESTRDKRKMDGGGYEKNKRVYFLITMMARMGGEKIEVHRREKTLRWFRSHFYKAMEGSCREKDK